jgi:hypothetical protein
MLTQEVSCYTHHEEITLKLRLEGEEYERKLDGKRFAVVET